MAGKIYLGCGSAADEAVLWQTMLVRPVTHIVYWPFALPSTMLAGADQWLRANLDQTGASYELQTWLQLDHHTQSDLDDADLLFVGGATPSASWTRLPEPNEAGLLDLRSLRLISGFLSVVRRFVADGGGYWCVDTPPLHDRSAGCSATLGDICWGHAHRLARGCWLVP